MPIRHYRFKLCWYITLLILIPLGSVLESKPPDRTLRGHPSGSLCHLGSLGAWNMASDKGVGRLSHSLRPLLVSTLVWNDVRIVCILERFLTAEQ